MATTNAAGPPVVLFPSLAGSVLECEESPVDSYAGKRIWMGLGTLLSGASDYPIEIQGGSQSSHLVSHPFVQHLVLDPARPGCDFAGIKVKGSTPDGKWR